MPSAGTAAAITVLVVDDHHSGRYLMAFTLEQAGFRVIEAATGETALLMVAEHHPALVVLDIKLPGMDGISVCRTIKQDPATASTMVLQISACYTTADNQIEGLNSGADSYLPGDVAPALLVAVVRALLRTRRIEEALRDREERLQLLEALNRSQEELRALAASLLTAQEEERRRIARELHDDLAQKLAVLEIELVHLRQQSAEPSVLLDAAIARVSAVSEAIREISHRLHPGILEHLGLETALRRLCDEWERTHQLAVRYVCPVVIPPVPSPIATALYHIAQEALRNVAKHAGDARVTVILSRTERELNLSIQDDGCGFDPKAFRPTPGLGLISMQERARLLAGSVMLHSRPGQGTKVEVSIPWSEKREDGLEF